jgi:ATP-binding cassette subfamily B protein
MLEALARRSRLAGRPADLPIPPQGRFETVEEDFDRWLDIAAGEIGLEAEPVYSLYADIERLLEAGAPAVLRLPGTLADDQPRLIALLQGGRRRLTILGPDLRKRRCRTEDLRSLLCEPYEVRIAGDIEQIIDEAGVREERRRRARTAILREHLASVRIEAGWLLRLNPGARMRRQFRQSRSYLPLTVLTVMYLFEQLLSIGAWIVIGRGVFLGHYDWGWLLAWIILLFATIPVQLVVSDSQSELSIGAGVIFKQRLLHGTLKLNPDEIRHQGMGQFLGRVMESESVEMMALSGGFLAVLSVVELVLAGVILANGAGGAVHTGLLVFWVLVTLVFLWRYYQRSREWAVAYRDMTNDVVERMIGHRTRLAQEDPERWHEDEDRGLDRYLKLSEGLDRVGIQLNAVIARGWVIVGLVGILFPFIANASTPAKLAVSLGGILLATQALTKLAGGVQSLTGLLIAWQQVGPLFEAAARPRELPSLEYLKGDFSRIDRVTVAAAGNGREHGRLPLITARDLWFRYQPHARPVLQSLDLQILEGDRLLLEGPSGGGKSTLAAILTGMRVQDSGSLLMQGLDRQILGSEEWRRRVVMAPQFQENHVFSDTFAYNLLMGRRWPPRPDDLAEADVICRELGLGDLLDRMPSGFQQMLGESGWQLSHGERSRLFIARTLLQKAELVILDESFGALDPENLGRALKTALRRAPTLMVIAHP